MDAWSIVARSADAHLGVVSRRDVRKHGVSHRQLATFVAMGRLEPLGPQALRIVGAPGNHEQVLLAAMLDLGPSAVVSRAAAARLLGFDGFEAAGPTFTMPRSTWRPHDHWRVHLTRSLPAIDTVTIGRFKVTSGARTIIDLAATEPAKRLEAAIGSALRDGWTSEPFLRRRLGQLRRRGRTGVRALDMVLDGRPFAHSHLERLFLKLLAGVGLPRPQTQVILRDGGRFVARVDACWPHQRVIAELQGARPHASATQQQRDAQRHTELQVLGWTVLTFVYADVVERPHWILELVTRALALASGREIAPSDEVTGAPPLPER